MSAFPDSKTLSKSLSAIVGEPNKHFAIISREEFSESSTFPVEIITCESGDNKQIRLFGKYLAGKGPNNFGHRGGVEYEAKIYSEILSKTDLPKITYYGECRFAEKNEKLLILEYLGKNLSFTKSEDPNAISKAASWIGSFHRIHEGNAPAFVTVYKSKYYFSWVDRFNNLTTELRSTSLWLNDLLAFFTSNIDQLTSAPQTIIHGEYYPKNILLKDGIIYPVDWESAAIATGEIDLASLIEGWDEQPAEEAKEAYKLDRWQSRKDSIQFFEKKLLLARIYFYLWRWPDKFDLSKWNENSYEFQQAFQLTKETASY